MSTRALLADLAIADICIEARRDRLHVEVPAGAMTDELIQYLREYKAELLRLLTAESATPAAAPENATPAAEPLSAVTLLADEDTREFFEERAAIAEYDGELSRDEAEQQAASRVVEYRLTGIDQWLTLIGPADGDMPTAKRWLHARFGDRVQAVRRYRPGS